MFRAEDFILHFPKTKNQKCKILRKVFENTSNNLEEQNLKFIKWANIVVALAE